MACFLKKGMGQIYPSSLVTSLVFKKNTQYSHHVDKLVLSLFFYAIVEIVF